MFHTNVKNCSIKSFRHMLLTVSTQKLKKQRKKSLFLRKKNNLLFKEKNIFFSRRKTIANFFRFFIRLKLASFQIWQKTKCSSLSIDVLSINVLSIDVFSIDFMSFDVKSDIKVGEGTLDEVVQVVGVEVGAVGFCQVAI